MNAAPNKPKKPCDGRSVAVIVTDPQLGVLIGDISDGRGASGVGGHVTDDFADFDEAAHGEVREETGLIVTSLRPLFEEPRWRSNPCKRGDGPFGLGHFWQLYVAEVEGCLTPDKGSFSKMGWVAKADLQKLAERTLLRVRNELTDEEWASRPGLTFSWVRWLVEADLIEMAEPKLQEIEKFMLTDKTNRP
ncbi:NUDIX hydrolase [Actinomadura citrea]|uniref:NUDIX hydrolase n=1 Tax=Actinomadura citrea TaxID=46158 RepID=UPI002E291CA0|nr:NUDIX hydrolase [Actinomadura citrea]